MYHILIFVFCNDDDDDDDDDDDVYDDSDDYVEFIKFEVGVVLASLCLL